MTLVKLTIMKSPLLIKLKKKVKVWVFESKLDSAATYRHLNEQKFLKGHLLSGFLPDTFKRKFSIVSKDQSLSIDHNSKSLKIL